MHLLEHGAKAQLIFLNILYKYRLFKVSKSLLLSGFVKDK